MAHHITPEQQALLETALLTRQAALEQALNAQLGGEDRATHAREQLLQDGDDESAHDSDRAVDLARSDSAMESLRQVNAALLRLRDPQGGYGICSACGTAIAFERLQGKPEALRCVACQGALEAREGGGGGHRPSL